MNRLINLGVLSPQLLALAVVLVAWGGAPRTLMAQEGETVLLRLRPRVGDTLRVRMEQTSEFEGTRRLAGRRSGASADSTTHERSRLLVFTRICVDAVSGDGTMITAITDSVRLTSNAPGGAALEAASRAAEGSRVRLRVASDGATWLAPPEDPFAPQLRAFVTQLPATLPRDSVAIGQSWTRKMDIPLAPAPNASKGPTSLSGVFRLDSLSGDRRMAYVSLTGRLARNTSVPYGNGRKVAVVSTSGSINGTIEIDRERGWITEVRTTVVSRSLMDESAGGAPLTARMWMKISQWVRVY
ncbi:MAG: DUF6263 family protein [Gemmatimonadaceae bacterium]